MLYALQQRDDPYLEIMDRYDNDREQGDREADYFAAAFARLQEGMAETDADLLGVIYESYGHTNDAFGQYFTPENVTEVIADMSLGDVDPEQYGRDNPLTVADPACGSGRMLIHAAKQLPEGMEQAVFYGQDKDPICAKMAALNLCLFNLDGYVVVGDSLKVEARRMWETRRTVVGGEIRERDPADVGNPFEEALEPSEDDEHPDELSDLGETVEDFADVDIRQATFIEYRGDVGE